MRITGNNTTIISPIDDSTETFESGPSRNPETIAQDNSGPSKNPLSDLFFDEKGIGQSSALGKRFYPPDQVTSMSKEDYEESQRRRERADAAVKAAAEGVNAVSNILPTGEVTEIVPQIIISETVDRMVEKNTTASKDEPTSKTKTTEPKKDTKAESTNQNSAASEQSESKPSKVPQRDIGAKLNPDYVDPFYVDPQSTEPKRFWPKGPESKKVQPTQPKRKHHIKIDAKLDRETDKKGDDQLREIYNRQQSPSRTTYDLPANNISVLDPKLSSEQNVTNAVATPGSVSMNDGTEVPKPVSPQPKPMTYDLPVNGFPPNFFVETQLHQQPVVAPANPYPAQLQAVTVQPLNTSPFPKPITYDNPVSNPLSGLVINSTQQPPTTVSVNASPVASIQLQSGTVKPLNGVSIVSASVSQATTNNKDQTNQNTNAQLLQIQLNSRHILA